MCDEPLEFALGLGCSNAVPDAQGQRATSTAAGAQGQQVRASTALKPSPQDGKLRA